MYISTMFVGVMCVMVSMPALIRERAVSYRERASSMYAPEVHAASFALVEIPWLLLLVLIVIPPSYFSAQEARCRWTLPSTPHHPSALLTLARRSDRPAAIPRHLLLLHPRRVDVLVCVRCAGNYSIFLA